MADESFALADLPGAGSDRPPEERGALEIEDTAVTHVIEGAARRAPGGASRTGLLGRDVYPRAHVSVRHGRIWARLDVGVRWPGPTAATARDLARRVREEAARITGYEIAALDVIVHLTGGDDAPERRVR
ncbi:hypothetical protein K3N28_19840 [Glycomyces sp. TRM65418]|uniref:hypothetical protein n=1 Tax=Glycomyces sp. TRM65418 TaxID=2867006 RepID=UPI001CE52A9B|nr:hypothetical protein [Glycomyces sp. TRM65418]MCC3765316.1 hypothetical protein [Glycomyces sp. TRM65418]QZD54934.1 hypothetical protein K3N28_19745 [Glycomyces sp. TRM65418]